MATTYALPDFIADLDRITRDESSPHVITEKVEPLLGRLIRNPAALPAEYRTRGPGGGRGRYMLHRTPRFNITAVVWAPGDVAGSPHTALEVETGDRESKRLHSSTSRT